MILQFFAYASNSPGKPMVIVPDDSAPPPSRKANSSLVNRIEKPPLLQRLSGTGDRTRVPTGPASSTGSGPQRSRPRIASGGPHQKGTSKKAQVSKPKTVDDLDKELEAFMGVDEGSTESGPKTSAPPANAADADVQMS
jgi:THO complex subunit 4